MRARLLRSDRGSVSVLAAAVLLIAGSLALATTDLLRALDARARAQAAADAAALAAARELAIPTGIPPATAAADYAERNGAILVACACPTGGHDAVVTVRVTVGLIFVGVDRTLEASARATVATAVAPRLPTGPVRGPPPLE
jgi:secretion/DNA translocation related TadE-like protein